MLKVALFLEIVLEGDRPGHQAALGQLENRLIEALMHGHVKMERAQKIADPLQGAVVNHQRAQKPLLRFEVMRHDAVCGLLITDGWHGALGRRFDIRIYSH